MNTKLSEVEIGMLQSLDQDRNNPVQAFTGGDLPKRLFEFNLVSHRPNGGAAITKNGQRALFQHECMSALLSMQRGEAPRAGNGVEKWLVSSGFAALSDAGDGLTITSRGKLWLTSFEPDAPMAAVAPTAEYFALRRS